MGQIEIVCGACNKTFIDYASNHRKYCSLKCRRPNAKYKRINGIWYRSKCVDCGRLLVRYDGKRCRNCNTRYRNENGLIYYDGSKHIGEDNPNWTGDEVSYGALHSWVIRHKGQPSLCEHCGNLSASKYQWANKSHQYLRDLDDWLRLCIPCHQKYDGIRYDLMAKGIKYKQIVRK